MRRWVSSLVVASVGLVAAGWNGSGPILVAPTTTRPLEDVSAVVLEGHARDICRGDDALLVAFELTGPDGVTRTVFSDVSGRWRFDGLAAGHHRLDIIFASARARRELELRAGRATIVDETVEQHETIVVPAKKALRR